MVLNEDFVFERPLSVTGVIMIDGELNYHQFVLNSIGLDQHGNQCYILQNSQMRTKSKDDERIVHIPTSNPFYASSKTDGILFQADTLYQTRERYVNDDILENMEDGIWYLRERAFEMKLVSKPGAYRASPPSNSISKTRAAYSANVKFQIENKQQRTNSTCCPRRRIFPFS